MNSSMILYILLIWVIITYIAAIQSQLLNLWAFPILILISYNNISGHLQSSMFSKLNTLQTFDLSYNPLLSFSTYSIVDYTLP